MDAKQFKDLYDKYSKGDTLTSDQIKEMQKFLKSQGYDLGTFGDSKDGIDGKIGKVTKKAIDDYNDSVNNSNNNKSPQSSTTTQADDSEPTASDSPQKSDADKAMESFLEQSKKDKDEYEQREKAKTDLERDIDYKSADIYNIAKGATDLGKYIESVNQIQAGKRAKQALMGKQPKMPTQATSEDLKEAARLSAAKAQKGFSEQTLGAMGQKQLTDYANALKVAQSTGQAGTTLAAAGDLYRRTLGANVDTAIANENTNLTNLSQFGALAGAKANEIKAINDAINQNYYLNRKEHNQRIGEANVLERAGRINKGNVIATIPTTAANLARTYYRAGEQRGYKPLRGTPEYDAWEANRTAQKDYDAAQRKARRLAQRQDILRNAYLQDEYLNKPYIMDEPYTPYYGGVDINPYAKGSGVMKNSPDNY